MQTKEKIIPIPEVLNDQEFDRLLRQVAVIEQDLRTEKGDVVFEMFKTKYIDPLGILLLSHLVDHVHALKCQCLFRYPSEEEGPVRWLLRHMGVAKPKKEIGGELRDYLDKHRVSVQRCSNAKESAAAFNKKLLPVLKEQYNLPEPILKAMVWALWEVIDNAGVHGYGSDLIAEGEASYRSPVYFCAHDFEDKVQIAILDRGQGIANSFHRSGNKKYESLADDQALDVAIQKGTTGNPHGSPGFGLFGCAELARQSGGTLVIISASAKLEIHRKNQRVIKCDKYDGTMVSLSLPKNSEISLKAIFGESAIMTRDSFDDIFGEFK